MCANILNMNPSCPKCKKAVYPTEKFQCLDQTWHKACFTCVVCNMQLNMKNYRGFQKQPYCNAHYPQLKATAVVDTPENQRLASQTKNQSQVAYHAEYEKLKGTYTEVADTPEMQQARAQSALGARYNQRPAEDAATDYSAQQAPVPMMGGGGMMGGGMPRAAAPPPAPVYSGPRHRAQFPYEATDTDEVSFVEGDIILHAEIVSEGWMKGTVERTGASGLLPSNYVEPV